MPWEPQLFSGNHPSSYSTALHELAESGYADVSYASSIKKTTTTKLIRSAKLTKLGQEYLEAVNTKLAKRGN
jgi:hypothetical protein